MKERSAFFVLRLMTYMEQIFWIQVLSLIGLTAIAAISPTSTTTWWFCVAAAGLCLSLVLGEITHQDQDHSPPPVATEAYTKEVTLDETSGGGGASEQAHMGHRRVMEPTTRPSISPYEFWADVVGNPEHRGRPLRLSRSYSSYMPETR
jgi:hypothetical protein